MTEYLAIQTCSKGNASAFRRFISTGGGGLLIVVLLFAAIMSVVSKQFLSAFNIFVVLRDVSTAVLIGFSQMIVLAIGQMNLSVGASAGWWWSSRAALMEVLPLADLGGGDWRGLLSASWRACSTAS